MTTATVTTEQILTDALASIDAGYWTCGTIAHVNPDGQVVGCALGMVGLAAGLGHLTEAYGKPIYEMDYPSDGTWPEEALDAVDALAATTQGIDNADLWDAENLVIEFNDGSGRSTRNGRLDAAGAKAWFTRALESVQA